MIWSPPTSKLSSKSSLVRFCFDPPSSLVAADGRHGATSHGAVGIAALASSCYIFKMTDGEVYSGSEARGCVSYGRFCGPDYFELWGVFWKRTYAPG